MNAKTIGNVVTLSQPKCDRFRYHTIHLTLLDWPNTSAFFKGAMLGLGDDRNEGSTLPQYNNGEAS